MQSSGTAPWVESAPGAEEEQVQHLVTLTETFGVSSRFTGLGVRVRFQNHVTFHPQSFIQEPAGIRNKVYRESDLN